MVRSVDLDESGRRVPSLRRVRGWSPSLVSRGESLRTQGRSLMAGELFSVSNIQHAFAVVIQGANFIRSIVETQRLPGTVRFSREGEVNVRENVFL